MSIIYRKSTNARIRRAKWNSQASPEQNTIINGRLSLTFPTLSITSISSQRNSANCFISLYLHGLNFVCRVHLNDQIPCTIAGCPRKFDRNCDLRRHLEKAHRNGQLVVPSARAPPKQLQHQLQPQQQQHQQCEAQQEVLPVVEHTPDQQQPLLPSQFPQEETTYTTMQTVSQQVFYFRTAN